ncbi:flagellar motor switch protein FliN [Candidatus Laterigemmans baculatus]|uniref:flagellar motor switch protein FliN n=1 Tax=Candidatus Laterigemmans baculatus TaxID=2770505 RepID=UPI0013DD29A4|nr:flagellar motor switch protein FliN [Candidatus Laterigemmans baculatus]
MSDEQDPQDASSGPTAGGAERARAEGLDKDSIESLLQQAESGIAEAAGGSQGGGASQGAGSAPPTAFELGELEPGEINGPGQSLDLLGDVELDLRIELGRTMMRLEDVLELRGGSVVVLDKLAGDPVDIFVNGRLVARGEVLVMNDNFCVRVTELAGSLV